MGKRVVYTKITPLPSNIPRQLALDMLHSHGEIIELNPLVTNYKPIPAPRDAARDEFFAQWYEIEEIITWGFGMRKKLSFKGVFHDMPWGLQTHTYVPLGVDLRNKYQICGNQPGEPREVRELGIDAPADGLYLREDVEIIANVALVGFIKKETKQTLQTMIERMTKKAELLDDGVLHAMFENGRLKTVNPNQMQLFSYKETPRLMSSGSSAASSPTSPPPGLGEFTPAQTYTRYSNLPGRMSTLTPAHPVEMDIRPNSDDSGHTRPFGQAVEMETPAVYGGDKERSFAAELPDTSSVTSQSTYQYSSTSTNNQDHIRKTSLVTNPSFRSGQSVASDGKVSISSMYSQDAACPAPLQPRSSDTGHSIGRASSGRSYSVTNPDPSIAPHHQRTSSHRSDTKAESNHQYPNVSASPYADTLSGNMASLSMADSSSLLLPAGHVRCSMCNEFQGSKEEVSLHVNRNHFSP